MVTLRRTLLIALAGILLVAIAAAANPWPISMLVRWSSNGDSAAAVAAMERHSPDAGVLAELDVQHPGAPGLPAVDVFTPDDGATDPLPTVVWVHGGAWISGSKSNVAPYLRILAAEGYTAIGLGYTLAPEARHDEVIGQLNDGLAALVEHADRHRIDPARIVLAGDSAGAQLASELAALSSNPGYADLLGIDPALDGEQVAGVILHCGVYDLPALAALDGFGAARLKTAVWAYTGTRDWARTEPGRTMSTIDFVTDDFAPTMITGGNGDVLTPTQGVPMRERLLEHGVDVTSLLWPADHEPALPHEYQFHLHTDEAQQTLARTIEFLARVTR